MYVSILFYSISCISLSFQHSIFVDTPFYYIECLSVELCDVFAYMNVEGGNTKDPTELRHGSQYPFLFISHFEAASGNTVFSSMEIL